MFFFIPRIIKEKGFFIIWEDWACEAGCFKPSESLKCSLCFQVLQRRNSGRLDFMKRWRQYIAGFGNMTDEFWLGEGPSLFKIKHFWMNSNQGPSPLNFILSGNEKIYELTNTPTQYEVRFDLGLGSERAYAVYDNFKIGTVKQKYKLTIGKYRGTAGELSIPY